MGQIRKIQIPRMLNFWSWKITSITRLYCNIGSFDDGGDIVKVSCKPLGHPDGEPYPSEEIVQQFFKDLEKNTGVDYDITLDTVYRIEDPLFCEVCAARILSLAVFLIF